MLVQICEQHLPGYYSPGLVSGCGLEILSWGTYDWSLGV